MYAVTDSGLYVLKNGMSRGWDRILIKSGEEKPGEDYDPGSADQSEEDQLTSLTTIAAGSKGRRGQGAPAAF